MRAACGRGAGFFQRCKFVSTQGLSTTVPLSVFNCMFCWKKNSEHSKKSPPLPQAAVTFLSHFSSNKVEANKPRALNDDDLVGVRCTEERSSRSEKLEKFVFKIHAPEAYKAPLRQVEMDHDCPTPPPQHEEEDTSCPHLTYSFFFQQHMPVNTLKIPPPCRKMPSPH